MTATALVEQLDVDDGPLCPSCAGCSWVVRIEACELPVPRSDAMTVGALLQLRVVEIRCSSCGLIVDVEESDESRWWPDPSDQPPSDLP